MTTRTRPDAPASPAPEPLGLLRRALDAGLALPAVAAAAGLSADALHRRVRAATGLAPGRYRTLLRLKRASVRLALQQSRPITDIAFEAGYANAESFSRAFRRLLQQSPRAFRAAPCWARWRSVFAVLVHPEVPAMHVEIVEFPATPVAMVRHLGSTTDVHDSTRRLVEWRIRNRVPPGAAATYGVHHDLRLQADSGYRIDICVAWSRPVPANPQGVEAGQIAAGRCARVRYVGSRDHIPVVAPLLTEWLPASGERLRDAPLFFHYVNVGPDVADHDMVTDVYLPIE